MQKLFSELREQLLRAGVAPRHVRRYCAELAAHQADLQAEEQRAGLDEAHAASAAFLRLGTADDLAHAMIAQRQFQSWSVRAPWAVFALAPLSLLALAWVLALVILWSGWKIFLPELNSPFVELDGLAIFYFGIGRLLFLGTPILIGWAIATIAIRQRLAPVWPMFGLLAVTLLGGTAQVQANRAAILRGFDHIHMGFTFSPSVQGSPYGLLHTLVLFSLTALPYLLWHWQKARSVPA